MKECIKCGSCCRHLRLGDKEVGLTLFPEEIHLFPKSTIRPHLGKGVNEPTTIFTYQHTENICVHLKENLCKVYEYRPLMCRSFPIKVGPKGLTFSPGCKGFLEIVKNSKMRSRDMEEIQSALEIAERLYKFHSDLKDNEKKWRYNLINEKWIPYGTFL